MGADARGRDLKFYLGQDMTGREKNTVWNVKRESAILRIKRILFTASEMTSWKGLMSGA